MAEEKKDFLGAIRGFQPLRADTQPGTNLHLRGWLDEALAQNKTDASLGSDRKCAQFLLGMVESMDPGEASAPR